MMTESFPVNAGNVPPPVSSLTPPFQPLPTQSTIPNPGMRRRKRKDPLQPPQKLKLERILGLTTASSNILATAESQDLIAYAAGAVVVLYNHKRNKQVGFLYPPTMTTSTTSANGATNAAAAMTGQVSVAGNMLSSSFMTPTAQDLSVTPNAASEKKIKTPASTRAKPISCLAFSPDGNYLAAGEMGHQPRILIWDVKARVLLHECRGHKFGVLSLAFSPNMRYLVSIGFQHDGYLYVWHWRKGIKLAGNKVTSKVNALSFSKNGTYFVTAGLRHVKFWYFDARGRVPKRGNLSSRETQVLDGRSGLLGALRESNFVAVGCDRGKTEHVYFLTDSGILCMFKEGRVIDKWVDLQVQSAYSIAISSNYVICACAGGIIRLFEPETLKYCGMLPKPHPLGADIGAITSPDMIKHADESTYYPDVIAISYDESAGKVTAVYADRSLFLWDIRDLKKIGKYRSFVYHSDCVWGVEPCPTSVDPNSAIPPHSFATHSSDGTVRFWNLDSSIHPNSTSSSFIISPRDTHSNASSPVSPIKSPTGAPVSPSSSTSVTGYRRNIYSRELVKMLYIDSDAADFSKIRRDVEFADDQYPDFGIRSLKMSSDGKLLATGDRNGNLRVHSMENWEQITYQEAHDSEILAMDVTNPSQDDVPYMIATASRDRLLHIFDINSGFQLVQTLDDHSSSITAVKFSKNAKRLISCGADKGVIFRTINQNESHYTTYHNYSGRGTVFDMSLDLNDHYAATVTGERRLFVFSIDSGKPLRVCKPETMEENVSGTSAENSGGSLINIDLDPFSGTFAVTSGSDRSLRLFDLTNGACIEKVCAHAELITAVKFVCTGHDTVRVVSTCSDGTIFVWKITEDIVCKMKTRAFDKDPKAQQMVMNIRTQEETVDDSKRGISQLRAMGQSPNAKARFRRVSTATVVRPTPSISQMVRQGERRTFSTMSPAESKYDDLYKKIAMSRRTQPSSPENASPAPVISKLTDKKPPMERKPLSGRKTPEGKLERLYNGIPTSGARERTVSHLSNYPPANRYQSSSGESSPRSTGFNPLRQRDTNNPRINAMLRHQASRDTLNKQPAASPGSKPRPRTNEAVIRRKRSANLSERQTNVESRLVHKAVEVNPLKRGATTTRNEEDGYVDVTGRPDHPDEEDDGEEAGDERDANDDDEDEDEDEEDEEEFIFIAPPPEQDDIGRPFQVTSHDDIHEVNINDKSAHPSEDEKIHTPEKQASGEETSGDDDDGSSEDNVDDAIIQAITSREAPRMTPSLSRTTSLSVASRRLSDVTEDSAKEGPDYDSTQLFTPAGSKESSGGSSPSCRDTPALRELQRKLGKAKKRQSFTARYLSSLSDRHGNPSFRREPLDNVLKNFSENAEEATIPIVPSRIDTSSATLGTSNGLVHPDNTSPALEASFRPKREQPVSEPVSPIKLAQSMPGPSTMTKLEDSVPESPVDAKAGPSPSGSPIEARPEQPVPEPSMEEKLELQGPPSPSDLAAQLQSDDVHSPHLLTESTSIHPAPEPVPNAVLKPLIPNQLSESVGEPLPEALPSGLKSSGDVATEDLSSAAEDTGHESSVSMEKVDSANTCASFNANHIFSDLDGAIILLDSVIDAYNTAKSLDGNQDFVATIETKLSSVVQKITQTTAQHCNSTTSESSSEDSSIQQANFALLDKYSTLLVQMVEKKLLSSPQ